MPLKGASLPQARPAPGRTTPAAAAPMSMKHAQTIEGQAETSFRKFDVDNNGTLDLKEFTEAFKHGLGLMHKTGLMTPDLQVSHARRCVRSSGIEEPAWDKG